MNDYNDVYDRIEEIALENNFIVKRFTREFPKFENMGDEGVNLMYVSIPYIHVFDGEVFTLSVFYDEKCTINTFYNEPNYEIYDGCEVGKFPTGDLEVEWLIKTAKKIIVKNKLTLLKDCKRHTKE